MIQGINDEKDLKYIKHINKHIKDRLVARHRLLTFEGQKSHHSSDFRPFCGDDRIVNLWSTRLQYRASTLDDGKMTHQTGRWQ